MTSNQLISELSAAVSEMIQDAGSNYLTLSDRELASSPAPGSWSILQCFEHLNRYNRFYNSEIKKKMTAGKASADHEVRTTWIGKKSIAAMHPDNQKKQKTLRHLNPHPDLDRRTIEEFIRHQHELLNLLSSAKTIDVNTVRISVEFFQLLKMNLAEAFQFVVLHQQRHFLQLARIRKQLRKPDEVFLKV
jgi:uncharacterized damage-inducible protein DinB